MAKSSIHIATGKSGYLLHNDRTQLTSNSIFRDEKNEVSRSAKEAFQLYREELGKRTAAYVARTKQKLQKNSITHLSAIVNLNQRHTLDDLQPLIDHLEKELDTKVFQAAIHRDEGHVGEDGKPIKNYHAHIEFMGIDSEGRSVRRKLTKKFLSQLQTKTAEILQMERGTNYAKERKPRPRRLDTYEYKAAKKAEEQAVKAKVADLKAEIASLREELKKERAARPQYAAMEQAAKEMKKQIKARELTIEQLREQMAQMRAELLKQIEKTRRAAERAEEAGNKARRRLIEIGDLRKETKRLRAELQKEKAARTQYAALEQAAAELKERVKARDMTIEDLRRQMEQLRGELLQQIEKTKQPTGEAEKRVQAAERRAKAAEGKAERLQTRAETAEKKAQELAERAKKAERWGEIMQDRAARESEERKRAEAKAERLQRVIDRLVGYIGNLAQKMGIAITKITTAEQAINAIDRQIDRLRSPATPEPNTDYYNYNYYDDDDEDAPSWGRGPGM
jgi:hypothetical protein